MNDQTSKKSLSGPEAGARFEIIEQHRGGGWPLLGAVLEVGRAVIGGAYASAARVILIRQENFEDRQAERRFAKRTRAAKRVEKPRLRVAG